MQKKKFIKQDILKMIELLGLKLDAQTGGFYAQDYEESKIRKNKLGLFEIFSDEQKITFLNGILFLTTVKTVEKNLNYKLFR